MHALVVEPPAQIRFPLNINHADFPQRRRRRNSHRLPKRIPANLQHAQPIHLPHPRACKIDQQRSLFDHLANPRLDQVVPLHLRRQRRAHVRRPHYRLARPGRGVSRLSRQIRDIHKSRRNLVPPPRLPHSIFQNRRERPAIEGRQIFFLAQRPQSPSIFRDYAVAHLHLFVKLDAHLKNFPKVFFVVVQHLVQLAVPDQNHLHIQVHRFRLQSAPAKRVKHLQRLNLQPVVIQSPLQSPPNPSLRKRLQRIHNQKSAVGPQQRPRPQIHKITGPPAPRVVSALNGPKQIRIGRRGLKNHRRAILIAMRQNYIHAIQTKRIAVRPTAWHLRHPIQRRRALAFTLSLTLALLKRIEVVQQVMPHFLQIFRHANIRIFLLQLFDHAIYKYRSRLLLQITQLASQFPRKRERLPVNHGKFLPKLLILPLDLLRHRRIQLSFMHHLRNILDGHHLSLEHWKNLRQRHRSDLHMPECKLLTRNPPREIVHQLFFAHRESLDDPPLLPLKRFALKHLRNPPPQKINPRLHLFFIGIRLPPWQRQKPGPIRNLEIIDVTPVHRRLRNGMQLLNHPGDRPAAASPRQPAHKNVVPRRRQFHAHFQSPQGPLLPDETFAQFRLRGGLKRQTRSLAPPPQFPWRQLRMHRSRFVPVHAHRSPVL